MVKPEALVQRKALFKSANFKYFTTKLELGLKLLLDERGQAY